MFGRRQASWCSWRKWPSRAWRAARGSLAIMCTLVQLRRGCAQPLAGFVRGEALFALCGRAIDALSSWASGPIRELAADRAQMLPPLNDTTRGTRSVGLERGPGAWARSVGPERGPGAWTRSVDPERGP